MDKPPKHMLLVDSRTGEATVLEIAATSPWHELLPQHQEVEIRPHAPELAKAA